MFGSQGVARVGVTFHPALLSRLLRSPPAFLEIVAESLSTSTSRKQARALAEVAPLSLHGTGLSLGSVEGFDVRRAVQLAKLRDELGAVAVSEHLAFVRAGDVDAGHLTPLPFTRAAVDVVARNLERVARLLPGLLLENVWSPLPARALPDELEEPEFLAAVVDATGCGLLLDVANLWGNATNRGLDPLAWIDRLPLAAVRQLHIAGSHVVDGFVIDSHADPVPAGVFELAAAVLARTGPVPVCLERDRDVDVDGVFGELERLRAMLGDIVPVDLTPPPPSPQEVERGEETPMSIASLGVWQRALALALNADDDGDPNLRHGRGILARKRREKRNSRPTTTTTSFFRSPLSFWSHP
ncbi:MAG: DUF692 domain-containing protein [Deltaproteobacteria bacterium]|nr:DUF692 domain-containing protein [Deltaproteobacteria bacterium]